MFGLLKTIGKWLSRQVVWGLTVAVVIGLGHYGLLAMPEVKAILCGIVAGVASRG